ncbi:DUF433 domain-containing protein [Candidatus Woesearchaeota archaeon]|nr:DUF433 domain-containing protein [Candidatus Woesearchaeota archaeon]
MEKDFMKRIVVNPKVMVGKPVIKGTRIPVYEIVLRVAQGWNFEQIMEDYPKLKKEDIQAALMYAERLLEGEEIFPLILKDKDEIPG